MAYWRKHSKSAEANTSLSNMTTIVILLPEWSKNGIICGHKFAVTYWKTTVLEKIKKIVTRYIMFHLDCTMI